MQHESSLQQADVVLGRRALDPRIGSRTGDVQHLTGLATEASEQPRHLLPLADARELSDIALEDEGDVVVEPAEPLGESPLDPVDLTTPVLERI